MRIAIAMRTFRCDGTEEFTADAEPDAEQCFAKFDLDQATRNATAENDDDDGETVQVTVVLRGRRGELEDPALGVTQLVLGALKAQAAEGPAPKSTRRTIDVTGVAVEAACG